MATSSAGGSNTVAKPTEAHDQIGRPNLNEEPDRETVHQFVRTLFRAAQLSSEYAITTLVYLERLMTYAEIDLTPKTWRRMFLGAILLSSKVWEDQAVWNVDYAQILEEISVDDINELERQFLELIQFNMNVPSSVYAKYYFHLRTFALENGLMEEQILLTTGKARDLEAMSKTVALNVCPNLSGNSGAIGGGAGAGGGGGGGGGAGKGPGQGSAAQPAAIDRRGLDQERWMRKHSSLEGLRFSGRGQAVLM